MEIKKLQTRDYVVSFMHLPVYLMIKKFLENWRDGELIPYQKLKEDATPGTDIEDGTRFLKVRVPKEVASLPYSTRLETAEGLQ